MFFSSLNQKLRGHPDEALTALLIFVALVALAVAFFAPPAFKAVVAAWFIAP